MLKKLSRYSRSCLVAGQRDHTTMALSLCLEWPRGQSGNMLTFHLSSKADCCSTKAYFWVLQTKLRSSGYVLHLKWSSNCHLAHRNITKCLFSKKLLKFIHGKDCLFIIIVNNTEYMLRMLFCINISKLNKRTAESSKITFTFINVFTYMWIYLPIYLSLYIYTHISNIILAFVFALQKPFSRNIFNCAPQSFKEVAKSATYYLSFKYSNIKITKLFAVSHTDSMKDKIRNNFQNITVIPQFI